MIESQLSTPRYGRAVDKRKGNDTVNGHVKPATEEMEMAESDIIPVVPGGAGYHISQ